MPKHDTTRSRNAARRDLSTASCRLPAANYKPAAGFTLIELIVYLGVVSFALLAAVSFAYEFIADSAKAQVVQEVNRNGRLAVSRIALDIREATDLNSGASTLGSNPSTLSLAKSPAGDNPTVFCVVGTVIRVSLGDATCDASDPAVTSARVQVQEFIIDDLSTSGRTKTFRIHLKLAASPTAGPIETTASGTFETTATIMKNDGFSN